MRDMSQAMVDIFTGKTVQPHILAKFYFDSGIVGMWSGYGTITFDGQDYLGAANMVGLSVIQETQETQAKGVIMTLNGISSELISAALSENLKNRPVKLYLASVDTSRHMVTEDSEGAILLEDGGYILLENQLVEDPVQIFSGIMDVIEFNDDAQTADIRLSAENILFRGRRNKLRRYTDEDQRKKFPDDTGLSRINLLQDREIVW